LFTNNNSAEKQNNIKYIQTYTEMESNEDTSSPPSNSLNKTVVYVSKKRLLELEFLEKNYAQVIASGVIAGAKLVQKNGITGSDTKK